jgi:histidinol-phosphatase (PHP family)
VIPADSHVHSEWSWDAVAGSMWRTCARAVELGLSALVFSEHADLTPWAIDPGDAGAIASAPEWERWYRDGVFTPPERDLTGYRRCLDVVRWYLGEVERLAEGFADFEVLAHIDYPVRYWPGGPAAFDPEPLQEAFRAALAALARSGRILEVNTRTPLSPIIVGWWRREGGRAVTFGSDAHEPDALARGFREAAAMAQAQGLRPGRDPCDPWPRG